MVRLPRRNLRHRPLFPRWALPAWRSDTRVTPGVAPPVGIGIGQTDGWPGIGAHAGRRRDLRDHDVGRRIARVNELPSARLHLGRRLLRRAIDADSDNESPSRADSRSDRSRSRRRPARRGSASPARPAPGAAPAATAGRRAAAASAASARRQCPEDLVDDDHDDDDQDDAEQIGLDDPRRGVAARLVATEALACNTVPL